MRLRCFLFIFSDTSSWITNGLKWISIQLFGTHRWKSPINMNQNLWVFGLNFLLDCFFPPNFLYWLTYSSSCRTFFSLSRWIDIWSHLIDMEQRRQWYSKGNERERERKRNMFSNLVFVLKWKQRDFGYMPFGVSSGSFFENWKDKFRDVYLWYG